MQGVLDRLARAASELVTVTEADAYSAWFEHVRHCGTCKPSTSGIVCAKGRRLHDTWKRVEAGAQPAAHPPRRGRR